MQNIERKAHLIDAEGQTVGRLATRIAALLMGKGKRSYAPHIDGGDSVTVANIKKVKISPKKLLQSAHRSFSGYPGGLKTTRWEILLAKNPDTLLRQAVYRMLPKNKLRPHMIKRLKIE